MFLCTNFPAVLSLFNANAPRDVVEVMKERHPKATFDGERFHAPCDGYVCPITGNVFRAGEFLPEPASEGGQKTHFTEFLVQETGKVQSLSGTRAQIEAVREELRAQTRAVEAAQSKHIGTVGAKMELNLKINKILVFDGRYGCTYMHLMSQGTNAVFYKGAKCLGKEGDSITIKAKIKEHTDYEGVPQTVIAFR